MKSRLLILAACLVASLTLVRADDFSWPGHGTVSFEVPRDWNFRGGQASISAFGWVGEPRSGAAAVLQLTLIELPAGKSIQAAEVQDQLRQSVRPVISDSVEKAFGPQPITLRQGTGWYAQFTDPALVGKPPVPGNFKVMRSALLALDTHSIVVATMQFDDPNRPEAAAMLSLVASMRFTRNAAVASAASDSLQLKQAGKGYEVTVPESRLILKIPVDGLDPQTLRVGGATNSPRYFELFRSSPNLIISGWFEPASRFKGLREFWQSESRGLSNGSGPAPENIDFLKIGDWEVVSYTTNLLAQGSNAHFRAELVKDGTWIDLHLSSTSGSSAKGALKALGDVLSAFQVVGK